MHAHKKKLMPKTKENLKLENSITYKKKTVKKKGSEIKLLKTVCMFVVSL